MTLTPDDLEDIYETCPYCGIKCESPCDRVPSGLCEQACNKVYGADPTKPRPRDTQVNHHGNP